MGQVRLSVTFSAFSAFSAFRRAQRAIYSLPELVEGALKLNYEFR